MGDKQIIEVHEGHALCVILNGGSDPRWLVETPGGRFYMPTMEAALELNELLSMPGVEIERKKRDPGPRD